MNRLHELRLIQATRAVENRTRPARVIDLESRRAQRLERIRRLSERPVRPDAA
jgi:hypothetical protein